MSANPFKSKEKKAKKSKVEEAVEEVVKKVVEEDPNSVSRFQISKALKAKLKEKGIESLFSIHAMTFDTILDCSDLVGRAHTGQLNSIYCKRVYFSVYWLVKIEFLFKFWIVDYINLQCCLFFLFIV